jgi:hypothetical protein
MCIFKYWLKLLLENCSFEIKLFHGKRWNSTGYHFVNFDFFYIGAGGSYAASLEKRLKDVFWPYW